MSGARLSAHSSAPQNSGPGPMSGPGMMHMPPPSMHARMPEFMTGPGAVGQSMGAVRGGLLSSPAPSAVGMSRPPPPGYLPSSAAGAPPSYVPSPSPPSAGAMYMPQSVAGGGMSGRVSATFMSQYHPSSGPSAPPQQASRMLPSHGSGMMTTPQTHTSMPMHAPMPAAMASTSSSYAPSHQPSSTFAPSRAISAAVQPAAMNRGDERMVCLMVHVCVTRCVLFGDFIAFMVSYGG
ncbi:hypothetical protein EON62_01020, partial [archaeon]